MFREKKKKKVRSGFPPFTKVCPPRLPGFRIGGPVSARASGQRTGRRNGGQVGKHSVCNFSRKYLWRTAATHCREPQEAIVAGLDSGRGEQNINCRTSVLLQWSERRRDAARWAEVSEMEREIKIWRGGRQRGSEGRGGRATHGNGRRWQKAPVCN